MKCPRAELARRDSTSATSDGPVDAGLLSDAAAALSDRHRAVLYRSVVLKRTTTQIAIELRIDDALVKQDLHHALHVLRTSLLGAERPTG